MFLIEPMWNWNYDQKSNLARCFDVFNWTNVELKHAFATQNQMIVGFLIEPMWNWNITRERKRSQL